ncbi:hypothetical protein SAMN05421872_10473 [Nocardioides lianchengensis]|uniref:RsbT co-antagonist protein RsbRD N-terminal domain-containing protein n=1 Tax=Nocardioides lianchengensis TaxID=1045774 RepID=A0A1G6PM06_9ACTN|nr:hypothetical protein [Nocardioides lianchengensis]SDC81240.1 hypothetical protein SAMN05421872_10473 [Nocardioides lianchengensis]
MSDLVAATAAAMLPEADLRTDEVVAQMLREIPELGGDRVLEDLLRTSVGDNVRSGIERFARGEVAPGQDAPASAIAYARLLAQRGVPVSSLLRAYRLGQAAFQERVLAGIAGSGADAETVLRVTIELTTASFAYIDGLAEQVVRVYQAERDAWVQRARPRVRRPSRRWSAAARSTSTAPSKSSATRCAAPTSAWSPGTTPASTTRCPGSSGRWPGWRNGPTARGRRWCCPPTAGRCTPGCRPRER